MEALLNVFFSRQRAVGWSAVGAVLILITERAFGGYLFHKVADTSTPIPGGVGTFTAFDEAAYDGQHVAFRARGTLAQDGVYLWNGATYVTVADANATVPNGGGRFDDFLALSLDAGHVAFVASGTLRDGVYTTLGGSLRKVADTSMTMPSSTVPFTQFTFSGDVAISEDNIVFSASGASASAANSGVYRESSGALLRVADRTTAIPEFNGSFISFSAVDAWEGETLFAGGQGSGGGNGFYTTSGAGAGQIRAVLNAATAVPGLSNPISIFSPSTIRMDGSAIAFSAGDSNGGRGVYLEQDGMIQKIADKNTLDPATGASYESFGTGLSLSASDVAFLGTSMGHAGIYLHNDKGIRSIIRANSVLDSKTVAALGLYGESLSGGSIAFRAGFIDGTSGIYIAEPTSDGAQLQTAEFYPLFDAGSSGVELVEMKPVITIQTHGEEEKRACFEFDLSQLPPAAEIRSAKLRLNVTAISASGQGGPSLTGYGYAGDTVLENSDLQRSDIVLCQTATAMGLGPLDVDLDAASLKFILQPTGILGVVLLASTAEDFISFDALEQVGGMPPKLTIEYSLASGDFNTDGLTDSKDLLVWQDNFGSLSGDLAQGDADGDADVDGSDFLIWQRAFSASGPAVQAPEPKAWSLFLLALTGLVVGRRLPVTALLYVN